MPSSRYLDKVYSNIHDYVIANNMKMELLYQLADDRLIPSFHCLYPKDHKYLYMFPKVILHDQEPILYNEQKDLWQELFWKSTRLDKRMILIVSEQNSKELDDLAKDLEVHQTYWFSNGALALEWFGDQRFTLDFDSLRKNKKIERLNKKFSCVNRLISGDRMYRPIISQFMMDNIDKDHLVLSCNTVDPVSNSHINQISQDKLPQRHLHILDPIKDSNHPILVNIRPSDLDDAGIKNSSFDANNYLFRDVFCHIVTETVFYTKCIHLTEKSLRPFVNHRPFILVGPHNSLSYLRQYGFKTFSDYWDESYDEIIDPHERLDSILNLILDLDKLSLKQMEAMLDDMADVLKHNYKHFFNGFGEIVHNELMTNLSNTVDKCKAIPNYDGWILERIKNLDEEDLRRLIKNKVNAIKYDLTTPNHKQRSDTREALAKKDYKFIDETRVSFLLTHDFGFDETVSKEEILAHFRPLLS